MKKGNIYKCEICGNVVEVLSVGGGALVCCGENMKLLEEKSGNEGLEKHVPVIEENGNNVIIKIGSIPHPMEETHLIEWVEIKTNKAIHKKYFSPNDNPEYSITLQDNEKIESVRAYCNKHGLWKA